MGEGIPDPIVSRLAALEKALEESRQARICVRQHGRTESVDRYQAIEAEEYVAGELAIAIEEAVDDLGETLGPRELEKLGAAVLRILRKAVNAAERGR